MQIDHQRAAMRYQNKVNNAQGHFFEQAIKAACALYASRGRATADKTPEPFRVLEKSRDGIFKGRFTARAQPDFQGTLAGGRSIVFEAKYTTTDRLKWDVLTQEQRDALARQCSRALAEKKIDRPATEAIDKTQYRINVDESTGEIINFPGETEAEQ